MNISDIFSSLPSLETEHLILKKITMADTQDMFEYASDSEVAKYSLWDAHKSTADSVTFIKSVLQRYEKNEVAPWGVINKKDEKFIGTNGFMLWYPNHNRAEIAYALSRKYWGQGLTTEAVSAVIRFGFEKMLLNRIEARCFVENIGSERVMQKVGMKFEGIQRQSLFAKGKYRDLKVYSILKSEFSR